MKNYKVVATIEFPHHEEYIIWEPEFYGQMCYNKIDIEALFYDIKSNGFSDAPVHVLLELYDNPQVKNIGLKMGDNEVIRQLLIGTKILPIRSY